MNGRSQVVPADARGNDRSVKPTFRAATTTAFAAAAGTAPFFLMYGKADRVLIVQRIVVTGPTLTAVAYNSVNCVKYSGAAPSDGTAVALTTVPLDSGYAALGSTPALLSVYTAAPTAGTLIGTIASRRTLMQATVAAAAGVFDSHAWIFDFRSQGENSGIYLRSATEGIGLLFPAAPASAVTMSLEVEWTGEPYA